MRIVFTLGQIHYGHCRLLVIMVAMLTRGDRLVELKVTMLNIALDVGKCS